MNAQFTKDQQAAVRTLLSMFHPDKCPDELKDVATSLTQAINKADDAGTYSVISQLMSLVGKYKVTKDTKAGMTDVWAEFNTQPKTEGTRSGSSGPKQKAKPEKAAPKVDPATMEKVKAKYAETGWERKRMNAWMGGEFGLFGEYAKAYLDILFPKAESTGRRGYIDDLYDLLKKGPMTEAELTVFLKSTGSDNAVKHHKYYWGLCEMVNTIWKNK